MMPLYRNTKKKIHLQVKVHSRSDTIEAAEVVCLKINKFKKCVRCGLLSVQRVHRLGRLGLAWPCIAAFLSLNHFPSFRPHLIYVRMDVYNLNYNTSVQ